jgi:hypothetical protein
VRSWNRNASPFELNTYGTSRIRANRVIVVFGLYDGQSDSEFVRVDIVGTFWLAAYRKPAANDDTALGEIDLFANLIHQVPLVVSYESRRDELRTDVAFAKGLFVYLGHLMLKDFSPINRAVSRPRRTRLLSRTR